MLSFSAPAPPRHQEIDASCLLLGEGTHEGLFFSALIRHMGIQDVQPGDYGGIRNLKIALHAMKTVPGYGKLSAIGLTCDADESHEGAFQTVRGALRDEGFPAPSSPNRFVSAAINVGIFVIPDCRSQGMLETLCVSTLGEDPALACAREYLACLAARAGWDGGSLRKREKSLAHAWLASRDKPDLHPGTAAREGYWLFDSPALEPLRRFIRDLAGLGPPTL